MNKQITQLQMFVLALLVSVVLIPTGALHNIVKSIYETFQLKFWKGVLHFFKYWLRVAWQVIVVLCYLLYSAAVCIDLLWNALAGELVEDIVTAEEKTLFGEGDVTISSAIGKEEVYRTLNNTGKKFSLFLNRVFREKSHAVTSYKRMIRDIEEREQNKI